MRSELEQRFPTLSQSRFAPYVPRHTYRPPASSTRFPRRRASTVVGVAKKFTKDIILLARADGDSIPRGSKRAVLHDEARIANMVDFQSSWNERQVMERIESCFKGVIDLAKPYPRYVCCVIIVHSKVVPIQHTSTSLHHATIIIIVLTIATYHIKFNTT